jgi:hypothetical protein
MTEPTECRFLGEDAQCCHPEGKPSQQFECDFVLNNRANLCDKREPEDTCDVCQNFNDTHRICTHGHTITMSPHEPVAYYREDCSEFERGLFERKGKDGHADRI